MDKMIMSDSQRQSLAAGERVLKVVLDERRVTKLHELVARVGNGTPRRTHRQHRRVARTVPGHSPVFMACRKMTLHILKLSNESKENCGFQTRDSWSFEIYRLRMTKVAFVAHIYLFPIHIFS